MSFRDTTAAFFDELATIVGRKREGKPVENNPRPFSTILTQDDEPVDTDYSEVPDEDPEIITRM